MPSAIIFPLTSNRVIIALPTKLTICIAETFVLLSSYVTNILPAFTDQYSAVHWNESSIVKVYRCKSESTQKVKSKPWFVQRIAWRH